jgi:catechol 2,3-dioxygenase-like lactoylglutathione lyase family enzyme
MHVQRSVHPEEHKEEPMAARIHHANVPAHDVRVVARFYREVLGLTEVEMPVKEGIGTPEQQLVAWFDPGNGLPGLHVVLPRVDFAKEHNMFLNPITHGHIAWTVDDIEEAKRKLDERGVYYADARNYLMSNLYQIYTTDPEGNVVEINQELG